jgi:hypothetical protein
MQNRGESRGKKIVITIQTQTDLAECVTRVTWLSGSATSDLKLSLNVTRREKMLKILSPATTLGHNSRVQKPGPRPTALAFPNPRPGQKPSQAKSWARLGPAFFGLAWPGFWPQAGAGTSLLVSGPYVFIFPTHPFPLPPTPCFPIRSFTIYFFAVVQG